MIPSVYQQFPLNKSGGASGLNTRTALRNLAFMERVTMTIPIPKLTDKDKARFWAKVDMCGPDECWPWISRKGSSGYGSFKLQGKVYKATRVALAIDGRDPDRLHARHHCDNPPCCNPAHLDAGTAADNMQDMLSRGRGNKARGDANGSRTKPDRLARGERNGSRLHRESRPRGDTHWTRSNPVLTRGESNGRAKLTEQDIRDIRADQRPRAVVAAAYGVEYSRVSKIINRKAWAHIA